MEAELEYMKNLCKYKWKLFCNYGKYKHFNFKVALTYLQKPAEWFSRSILKYHWCTIEHTFMQKIRGKKHKKELR